MPPVSGNGSNGRWLYWLVGVLVSMLTAWAGWQHNWNARQDECLTDHGARLSASERRIEDNIVWIRDSLKRIEDRQRGNQ